MSANPIPRTAIGLDASGRLADVVTMVDALRQSDELARSVAPWPSHKLAEGTPHAVGAPPTWARANFA
ncbi:hypothetical protein [Actinopolymorpha pittospori]